VLAELNRIGGEHGIGRADIVENRYVGMKSRGCYETPGGTIMLKAHRAMESLTLDREAAHLKDELMPRYAELIYNGYWFSPEREMLQAAIDQTQQVVNGDVRLKLYKGNVLVVGRRSETTACSTSPSPPSRRTPAPTIRATRPASSAQCAAAAARAAMSSWTGSATTPRCIRLHRGAETAADLAPLLARPLRRRRRLPRCGCRTSFLRLRGAARRGRGELDIGDDALGYARRLAEDAARELRAPPRSASASAPAAAGCPRSAPGSIPIRPTASPSSPVAVAPCWRTTWAWARPCRPSPPPTGCTATTASSACSSSARPR
jgi:hypothetical protein